VVAVETTINSLTELEKYAENFLRVLAPQKDRATIVGLSGDLGAGKTTFVGALARALGISETILSPTFVIAKFYPLHGQHPWSRLVHIDAYRMDDVRELGALRFEELAADPKNLIVVEWPQRIETALPKSAQQLTFRFIDETTRAIS
jgi:tRNA threonylcarbamoyladenosine biosynthesis protein TsaE